MSLDEYTIVGLGLLAVLFAARIWWRLSEMNSRLTETRIMQDEFRSMADVVITEWLVPPRGLGAVASKKKVTAAKKQSIQRAGPKTFYYLDSRQVQDLHSQAFQELEPKEVQTRESRHKAKGIIAKLNPFGAKYETGEATETEKLYEIEQTPAVMYNKVEKYLIQQGDVSFGLEDFEYNESAIGEFTTMCERMSSKFGFDVPEDLQRKFVSDRIRGFALDRVNEVSDASGYVAVQGEFTVSSVTNDSRVLTLNHPLNAYLSQEDPQVSIQLACDSGSLLPAGASAFTQANSVKITGFGKVVSWDKSAASLVINPIAIY